MSICKLVNQPPSTGNSATATLALETLLIHNQCSSLRFQLARSGQLFLDCQGQNGAILSLFASRSPLSSSAPHTCRCCSCSSCTWLPCAQPPKWSDPPPLAPLLPTPVAAASAPAARGWPSLLDPGAERPPLAAARHPGQQPAGHRGEGGRKVGQRSRQQEAVQDS